MAEKSGNKRISSTDEKEQKQKRAMLNKPQWMEAAKSTQCLTVEDIVKEVEVCFQEERAQRDLRLSMIIY
jgi:hypothetical protein